LDPPGEGGGGGLGLPWEPLEARLLFNSVSSSDLLKRLSMDARAAERVYSPILDAVDVCRTGAVGCDLRSLDPAVACSSCG